MPSKRSPRRPHGHTSIIDPPPHTARSSLSPPPHRGLFPGHFPAPDRIRPWRPGSLCSPGTYVCSGQPALPDTPGHVSLTLSPRLGHTNSEVQGHAGRDMPPAILPFPIPAARSCKVCHPQAPGQETEALKKLAPGQDDK